MKFVFGKAHPLVEPDWYVLINEDSAEMVALKWDARPRFTLLDKCNKKFLLFSKEGLTWLW